MVLHTASCCGTVCGRAMCSSAVLFLTGSVCVSYFNNKMSFSQQDMMCILQKTPYVAVLYQRCAAYLCDDATWHCSCAYLQLNQKREYDKHVTARGTCHGCSMNDATMTHPKSASATALRMFWSVLGCADRAISGQVDVVSG